MKRLRMTNGTVEDAPPVCHACQQPEADERAADGEWYHYECVPEGL